MAADRLVLDAISALNAGTETELLTSNPSQSQREEQLQLRRALEFQRERQLLRVLEACAGTAMTSGFNTWRGTCDVMPIEDQLFTTQRELRRAHAMLMNMHR